MRQLFQVHIPLLMSDPGLSVSKIIPDTSSPLHIRPVGVGCPVDLLAPDRIDVLIPTVESRPEILGNLYLKETLEKPGEKQCISHEGLLVPRLGLVLFKGHAIMREDSPGRYFCREVDLFIIDCTIRH